MTNLTAKPADVFLMPNGLPVHHLNVHETLAIYKEVFEEEVYLQEGVALQDGCCVLDIGANIGLFTLYIYDRYPNAHVYAAEPVPPIFEQLKKNVELYELAAAKLWRVAVSNENGEAQVSFYPNMTGNSGLYADPEVETAITKVFLENMAPNEPLFQERALLGKFETVLFPCERKTLSALIDEAGISRIDLLKVDVEKSELDVLNGIRPEHWPLIDQVVVEVHEVDNRVQRIVDMLAKQGLEARITQRPSLVNTGIFQVYGVSGRIRALDRPCPTSGRLPRWTDTGVEAEPSASSQPAHSPTEVAIMEIWSELLGVPVTAPDAEFFELGGHSLLAIVMMRKVYQKLNVEMPLTTIFEYRTVGDLSGYIDRLREAAQ